ncbi:molecular chaperone TorD [Pelagibius sp.]|uniref:molecular chaperone TorD n=1 Tax=Pelagibius sp. TaxID=1931238 RepID=UPI003BB1A156
MQAADAVPAAGFDKNAEPRIPEEERSYIYQWFAGLFGRELSAEALWSYHDDAGQALLDRLGSYPLLAPLAETVGDLIAEPQAIETKAMDLAGAFAWLFLGVGGRRSVPPYESHYTSKRGLLFQEASAQTAAVLAEFDLHVDAAFPEPPDHIAVQLTVMAEFARRALEAADPAQRQRSRDAQKTFLETRLLPWVGAFRDDCKAADRSRFYAMAASCLVDFLVADAHRIQAAPR